eukprot:6489582-Amphidinium_carterae.1
MDIPRIQAVAQKFPGRLTYLALHNMAKYMGVGPGASTQTRSQMFPSVAHSYLLTTFTPRHPEALQNVRTARELKTLCLCLDHLCQGEVLQTMDMIAQRIKAIEMSVRQGGWAQARFLELVPETEVTSASREELRQ